MACSSMQMYQAPVANTGAYDEKPYLGTYAYTGAMTPGPVDENRLATPGKFFATLGVGLAVGYVLGAMRNR